MLGGKLSSIDSRYLLNDAPQAIIAFYSTYDLVHKETKYLVYKKRPKVLLPIYKALTESRAVKYDTWIYVPKIKENSIGRIKLSISKSLKGVLKSMLFKGESFSIYYELTDGKTFSHKIVPKNAKDGLWLNPLILAPETNFPETSVKKVKVVCWDKQMVLDEFEYSFEEISFEKNDNLLLRVFGKQDSTVYFTKTNL
jgi:hypothetical protein